MSDVDVARDEIFISYCHKDRVWLEEFQIMLKPLVGRHDVNAWDDRSLKPGEKWFENIEAALQRATAAVLLVSKDFLASEFIAKQELPVILDKANESGIAVFWIPVNACLYEETPLGDLQAAHDPTNPLEALNQADRNLALLKICRKIRDVTRPKPERRRLSTHPSKSWLLADEPESDRVNPLVEHDSKLDRDLLFGAIALQMAYIDARQLAEACVGWAVDMSISLADCMIARKWITVQEKSAIEECIKRKLRTHGDIPETLSASIDGTVRSALRATNNAKIRQSIAQLQSIKTFGEKRVEELVGGSARFQWERIHREGALGQVWVALDTDLRRKVAAKVVRPNVAGMEAQRRLIDEACITSQLEHPNIVPVYEVGRRDDGEPFYVMRLLGGPTLMDDIARHHRSRPGGGLDPVERRRLLDVFVRVCNAVAYAHDKRIIHLDLKPENIVLGEFGEVNVVDWGLAQQIGDLTDKVDTLTENPPGTEVLIGTPAYMSPEQAGQKFKLFNERTDVYGLGAILYEILTGQAPHDVDTGDSRPITEVLQQIIEQDTPIASEVVASTPVLLNEICTNAMAKRQEDRQADAVELAAVVQNWLDEEPLSSYRVMVSFFEDQLQHEPSSYTNREALARNLVNLSLVLSGMGRKAASEYSLRQAIENYQQLIEQKPGESRYRADLAGARLHLYYVLLEMSRPTDAEIIKREALDDYEQLRRDDPARWEEVSVITGFLSAVPAETSEHISDEVESIEKVEADPNAEKTLDTPAIKATANLHHQVDMKSPITIEKNDPFDTDESLPPSQAEAMHSADFDHATVAPAAFSEETEFGVPIVGPRYRVQRAYAEGGVGKIFIAYDESLHREVALKEIRAELSSNSDITSRFIREAEITAKLEHPGVVPIYSLGTHPDGRVFYAMRFVRGQSLSDAIRAYHGRSVEPPSQSGTPRFDLAKLLRRFVDICLVLEYAHSCGIVHRDVKPNNVMLGPFGETVMLDWGLAKLFDEKDIVGDQNIQLTTRVGDTMLGAIVGTPAYMSPEQAKGRTDIGPATDIYSLGVILYQLLTGRLPFAADDAANLIEKVAASDFPRPKSVRADIPRALEAICLKAMALDPTDRFGQARQLGEDVENWLTGNPMVAFKESWLKRFTRRRPY